MYEEVKEHLKDMLEIVVKGVWFTALDLKSGYWQVEIDWESKPLISFTVGLHGFCECDHMLVG